MTGAFKAIMWRYLERRQPASTSLKLRQNILYVLPTRYGLAMLLLAVILYLLGSNYQNNLILLLSFLLIGLLGAVYCVGISELAWFTAALYRRGRPLLPARI